MSGVDDWVVGEVNDWVVINNWVVNYRWRIVKVEVLLEWVGLLEGWFVGMGGPWMGGGEKKKA